MRLSDFDYELPEDLIAQEPLADRSASRMLVVDRNKGTWRDLHFRDLPEFLGNGDCLTVNNSRVLPSRLFGTRPTGGKIEVLLLEPTTDDAFTWTALVRPGRKMLLGDTVHFSPDLSATVQHHGERGERLLRFYGTNDIYQALDQLGHMPLPPYIKRDDRIEDRERYQTVYNRERGSVAAPTAGLHFTPEVLAECQANGADFAQVTLHVGLGTFQPLEIEDFEGQRLHKERYSVTPENWDKIASAKRVVAVGTTSVRTVESVAATNQLEGKTDIFLYPGHRFQRVGAMITNFHLPKTSLVLLVAAFAGTELTLAAYRHAVDQRYRFFSYGDCMLIV